MPVQSKKVSVEILQIGMFVSGTDRPWAETPFPIQGFHIGNRQQIDTLQSLCDVVWIDVQKSRHNSTIDIRDITHVAGAYDQKDDLVIGREVINLKIRTIQNPYPYKASAPIQKEIKSAKKARKRIR